MPYTVYHEQRQELEQTRQQLLTAHSRIDKCNAQLLSMTKSMIDYKAKNKELEMLQ